MNIEQETDLNMSALGWRARSCSKGIRQYKKKQLTIRWMPRNRAWRLERQEAVSRRRTWTTKLQDFPTPEAAAVYVEMEL